MDRRHTIHVTSFASAAWTLAIACAIFSARPPLVSLAIGLAVTASIWVIARYTADRLKRELLAELHQDITPLQNSKRN